MQNWKFKQYKNVVYSFLDSCSEGMREALVRRLDLLSERGNELREPFTKSLGPGLFELRGKADNKEARLAFIFMPNRTICFVHAFFKKTRTTSSNDIKFAKKNKKIVEKGEEKTHGFNHIH